MNTKSAIYLFMVLGSAAGSYIPLLWGSSLFSMSSVILTAVGGLLGIWFGYKVTR